MKMQWPYLVFVCVAQSTTAWAAGAPDKGGYPSKPIRFIVPYPTGGAPDLLARMMGSKMTEAWGQQVLVDNRAGANGTIACEITARAPGDGYTIQMGSVATHAINPAIYSKIGYNALKDFAYITQVGYTPMLITAHPSVQANTVKELIALAKTKPGRLSYGTSGSGSVGHLSAEMFSSTAGVKLTHIPYKGIAVATTELLGGQINLTFGNMLNALPHIRAGKLKPIGVTSATRSPVLPETQAIAETLPGFEAILWWGVFAPASTPQPIVAKLNVEIVRVLKQPDIRERWSSDGTVITGSTAEELAARVRLDFDRWGKAVKLSGARVE